MHTQCGRLSFSQGIKYHDLSCLLRGFEFSFLFHEMDCTLYVIVYFSKCQSLHIDFCWWAHTRIAHINFFCSFIVISFLFVFLRWQKIVNGIKSMQILQTIRLTSHMQWKFIFMWEVQCVTAHSINDLNGFWSLLVFTFIFIFPCAFLCCIQHNNL